MSESEPRQISVVNFMKLLKQSPSASPIYFKHVNEEASADSNILRFDKYFNPDLKDDSKYFNNLGAFLSCVEKNVEKVQGDEAQMEKVCAKEFRNLRLRAFDNELMYHNVNKRFFVDELSIKKHESPY